MFGDKIIIKEEPAQEIYEELHISLPIMVLHQNPMMIPFENCEHDLSLLIK